MDYQSSNKQRQKKSKEQITFLENEFIKNPNWDHQKNIEIALRLNLTVNTVRKWNWDSRKKEGGKSKEKPASKGKAKK